MNNETCTMHPEQWRINFVHSYAKCDIMQMTYPIIIGINIKIYSLSIHSNFELAGAAQHNALHCTQERSAFCVLWSYDYGYYEVNIE